MFFATLMPIFFVQNVTFELFTRGGVHWRIQGCARDVPRGSKIFHFHAVLAKKLKNNSTFESWRPLGKILDPPLAQGRYGQLLLRGLSLHKGVKKIPEVFLFIYLF